MASLESLQTRAFAAQTITGRTADNASVALEIVYVPQATGDTPVVTVASATGITLADSLTTTGSLAFNTYTTIGALADKINSLNRWKARIVDALRSTTTASSVLLPDSGVTAASVNGESLFKVLIDQSVNDEIFFRVSADRGVLKDDMGRLKDQRPASYSHRVKINAIKYNLEVNADLSNGLRIYEYNPKDGTETQIWGSIIVDHADTTIDFSTNPITSGEGNDLIVMVKDGAIVDTALVNFLEVSYVRE